MHIKKHLNIAVLLSIVLLAGLPTFAQKMSAEDLVQKHIDSIGTKESLAQATTRVFVGSGTMNYRQSPLPLDTGAVQFASSGNKSVFAIVFNYNDYPYEKAAFNGKKISIGQPLGKKTPFGEFLRSQDVILEQGLFGGTLNSNWPLLNLTERKLKVSFGGKGKWDDTEAYKLKFTSKTNGLSVTLYFDMTNFRHIGSEYKYEISARIGTVTGNASQTPSYFSMKESFSDFKTDKGLTLPSKMKIDFESTGPSASSFRGATAQEFRLDLYETHFDQTLGDDAFSVS